MVCGVGWFTLALWRGHVYARGYAAVKRGDSETRVLELLGPPHGVTGPPENVAWGEASIRRNDGECVRER